MTAVTPMELPQAPAAYWTVARLVEWARAATPDEQHRRLDAPVLLVDPGRAVSGAFDDVLPTSVGLRPGGSKSRAQVGDDRLVVPIIPGPLNASAARLTIGRARVCDVVLPYPEVSKVHAYLHRGAPGTDSSYEIEDAGSMNGTSVNGKHLPRGERHAMVDRCKVSIGGIEAEYRVAAVFRAEVLARLAI